MSGEYFNIEDDRDLDGEPEDNLCHECLLNDATRVILDLGMKTAVCQQCYIDLKGHQ